MSSKQFLLFSSVILLLVIAVGFYWFQIRPSNIKTTCTGKANSDASETCRNVNTGRENGGLEA